MTNFEQIRQYQDELSAIRQRVHQHAEMGLEEIQTSALVAEKLHQWGVEVTEGIGKTGVVGVVRGTLPGKRMIGLRADMDALPILEQTGWFCRDSS